MPTNDLDSLSLLYCQPPAPGNLSADTREETGIALGWDAVSDTDMYRSEGTVNAVRYGTSAEDPEHSQTLTSLTTRITTAAAEDAFAADRIENIDGLDDTFQTEPRGASPCQI